jgi:hypothetical protein
MLICHILVPRPGTLVSDQAEGPSCRIQARLEPKPVRTGAIAILLHSPYSLRRQGWLC